MNHLWNLITKELKELLTPASVASVVIVAVLFGVMGGMINTETEKAMEVPAIGVISFDTPGGGVKDYYKDAFDYIHEIYGETKPSPYITEIKGVPPNNEPAIINKMNDLGISVVLVFDKNYSNNISKLAAGTGTASGGICVYWSEVKTGVFGSISTAMIDYLLEEIGTKTTESIIGGDYEPGVLKPIGRDNVTSFNGKIYDGVTPSEISSALQSQTLLMPILIMVIITIIGGMIISSMGSEKENKTLETLLTLPVKRTTIVSGKLIGSAIAGLLFGIVYLAGMYFYTNSISMGGSLSLESLGLTLSLLDWGVVAMVIFLAIMSALGICMILGAFVKNYKAAQTLTLPISVLAMIPMFVTMFVGFDSLPSFLQVIIFAIPFSHPMMIMNNLMLGNTFMIWGGLGYLIFFALMTIFVTVKIYNSDILLTGLVKKKGKINILSMFKRT
ncbi:MAG: ABC transporter permease [Methanomassiliicoccaceae archaeon]|nr:ABC transporter permease [Methanomassiliicoccaceae archaeon]